MRTKQLTLAFLLCVVSVVFPRSIENGSFEGEETSLVVWWNKNDVRSFQTFPEVRTPEGWWTWWFDQVDCEDGWWTGRPEARVISLSEGFDDEERIRHLDKAAMQFTFYRCHWMGLLQQVDVVEGRWYKVTAYAHSWYSRCSDRPHGPPLDSDCVTELDWAHDRLRLGLDPSGGLDPRENTYWGLEYEVYGTYGEKLESQTVLATESQMTIFLEARNTHPLKHNDVYWDEVVLEEYIPVVSLIYLPEVMR